jgi:retinol dehydrogenase 12
VSSGFGKNNAGLMGLLIGVFTRFGLSPEDGAKTNIYLASSPDVEGVTGKYYDKCKAVSSSQPSYDEAAQRQLWAMSEQLVGLAAAV